MILTDKHLEYMDKIDRCELARGSPRGLVASGWMEYVWELEDGSTVTDSQLALQGKALPPEGSRWLREAPTERGRKALQRYRRRLSTGGRKA